MEISRLRPKRSKLVYKNSLYRVHSLKMELILVHLVLVLLTPWGPSLKMKVWEMLGKAKLVSLWTVRTKLKGHLMDRPIPFIKPRNWLCNRGRPTTLTWLQPNGASSLPFLRPRFYFQPCLLLALLHLSSDLVFHSPIHTTKFKITR